MEFRLSNECWKCRSKAREQEDPCNKGFPKDFCSPGGADRIIFPTPDCDMCYGTGILPTEAGEEIVSIVEYVLGKHGLIKVEH